MKEFVMLLGIICFSISAAVGIGSLRSALGFKCGGACCQSPEAATVSDEDFELKP